MRSSSLLLFLLVSPSARADDRAAVDFFEKKIRPVLSEHCYPCHSTGAEKNRKLKGGLFLDSKAGWERGGDSGPAVVPGKPGESLLLRAMGYAGDTKMPPKGKLPEAVLADFEAWIKAGAADPRTAAAGGRRQVGMTVDDGRMFWAYRPVAPPAVPRVVDGSWPAGDIDRFVLAKLEAAKVKPAGPADPAALVRRLYFDLVGLPPKPEEIDAFLRSDGPRAYEQLVDRLLGSPQFGERWGRHWLDVARFAESVTLRGFVFPDAWRYRDYVIESFNADVPFDRFVREQIAGDLIPGGTTADRQRRLVATTFLALGNTNLEEQDKAQLRMDVVDEQLDAIAKGLLGQTVTCARCHDHKFDPIPTKDYYALAGILRNAKAMEHANVSKWVEVPLPVDPPEEGRYAKHEAAVAALRKRIQAAKGTSTAAKGILTVASVPGVVVDDAGAKRVGGWQESQHSGTYIGAGYLHDQNAGKGEKTLTFQPESLPAGKYDVLLAYSHGTSRSKAVPVTVFSADGEKAVPVNMTAVPPVEGRFVSLGEYRFEKDGLAYVLVSNEGTTGHVTADAVVFRPVDGARPAAKSAGGNDAKALEAELKKLLDTGPNRPRVMSVVEEGRIEDARVHVRGSVHSLGPVVPRGFLSVVPTRSAPIPADRSGRLELADWIVAPDNPLTARVFVNRAWHWLLGAGLVRTTDNFGTTGEAPTHPELLDHLAARFVADGWSVKRLVRTIVLSRTYRQSSSAEAAGLDPENRLFGRANRRRLDAECIRDGILAVSGRLDPGRGGPGFPEKLAADYGFQSDSRRRSIYLPYFRNAMPELLEAFDAADPSTVTGRRDTSTVAPQALYLMNHPFVRGEAAAAAERLLAESHPDDGSRVRRMYRLVLGRDPTAGESTVARNHLAGKEVTAAWTGLFHALFASADFRFVE